MPDPHDTGSDPLNAALDRLRDNCRDASWLRLGELVRDVLEAAGRFAK